MTAATSRLDRLVTTELNNLLNESLKKIRHCVEQLNEEQVWQRPEPSMNSVGNLLLHISGNLRQWAICGVGQTPDHRDRNAEFSQTSVLSRQELLAHVEGTVSETVRGFSQLDPGTLAEERRVQGFDVTVLSALLHTVTHFVGHTHQIIQLTRLLRGDAYQFQWTPEAPRDGVPI